MDTTTTAATDITDTTTTPTTDTTSMDIISTDTNRYCHGYY